jgi:hypothetical protein
VGRPRKRHRRDEDKYNSDGTISDSTVMPINTQQQQVSATTRLPLVSNSSRRASSIEPTQIDNNYNHTRTSSQSDTRHYPFYLLNNEETSANKIRTTLNGPGGGEGPPLK